MIRVGLTGGIGSGKSTVAKIFEVLGVPVYYADAATRELMNTDAEVKDAVIRHFGEQSYLDNLLNRKYISSIVFSDPKKLELLNSITHPATIRHAAAWMQTQHASYIIKEAALIFESGSAEGLDYVIGVYAPKPLRIKRVMQRDKISSDEVINIMNKQLDEEIKMKLCDFVLRNNEQELIIPQVIKLHEHLLFLT